MKKICIFCGSSMGYHPAYRAKAMELGQAMADQHYELLYGGGSVGLMKAIADVMLNNQCKVTGTITNQLMDMEVGYKDIDELIIVDTMAERKKLLEDKADGFIAMPGGYGTLDELFEVVVLSQLQVHNKPVALFNVNGYYDKLMAFLAHAVEEGFIHREHLDSLIVSDDPKELLKRMEQYQPVNIRKWVDEIRGENAECGINN